VVARNQARQFVAGDDHAIAKMKLSNDLRFDSPSFYRFAADDVI
jgi:hypothetical protein